jgi:hypothetical protein
MRSAIQIASLFITLFFAANELNAQIQNKWVGGTPGRPTDSDVASNWSLQRVPDEFSDVMIPNTSTTTFSYPSIDKSAGINSLRIENGAKLVIAETGKLQLNFASATSDALANAGEIENRSQNLIVFHGAASIKNDSLVASRNH